MALYGSTTVSETFGDGKIEKVSMILSGYSSQIFEMRRVPIPDPVPPLREWHTWNPCKQSHFSLLSYNIEDWVNQFSSLSVMTFGPVVSCSSLSENEVVWPEELSEGSSSDWVHDTWLEVHKNSSWYITAASSFVLVDIDFFELEVWVSVVGAGGVDSMFVRDNFPEFGTNLITALSSLNVNDFSHLKFIFLYLLPQNRLNLRSILSTGHIILNLIEIKLLILNFAYKLYKK